jgi:hypothetical protein
MKYNTMRKAIIRARRRKILIAALDGVCARPGCGSTEDLEFDHIDRSTKSFTISDGLDRPWIELIDEIMKCQLLCRPHHTEKSIEYGDIRTVDHGAGKSGKRNCSCAACKVRKREYMRTFMQGKRVRKNNKPYPGPGRYGTVEHGGGKTGKYGCKCDPCKARKAEYARNLRTRKNPGALAQPV